VRRPFPYGGFVAHFAQEVMQGSCPSLWRELSGQRVALFGRREALVALFEHQLPFLDHVKESIMTSAQVDVIVIGAGPAGVLAALRAADLDAHRAGS
jgi:NADPH-dependent 2,4-dienoyl-CoA reductase/sulfur reductase-like enzyme